ncbi:MAG TPA: tetratricopeptide repeat protein [Gemmatimonadaceae bacterium]
MSPARRWANALYTATLVAVALVLLYLAHTIRRDARNVGNPTRLAGSRACANCHALEYAAWRRSQHAESMQEARPSTVLGRFDESTLTYAGVATRFFRRADRYFVNTESADGQSRDFEIRYTFGVYPLQQYLVVFPDGRIQPLPVAWDSRLAAKGGQRWFHLTPGPRVIHTDERHWTGRQQNWNFMCADCHSTGVRKGYDAAADRFRTTWSEIDVGCEGCHGPAAGHIKWAGYPKLIRNLLWRGDRLPAQLTERRGVRWGIDSTTGNARRSIPRHTDREIESCAACHSRRVQIAEGYTAGSAFLDYYVPSLIATGLYFPDGQQRDEVYTHGSFLQSRMYHAGVTCSDCHEPHTQQLRAPGNAICAQCHLRAKYDTPRHTLHPAETAAATCASCHMPSTTYMQIDPRLDHSIRIPRPDLTVRTGVPNACNGCHTDRTAQWAAAQIASHFGAAPKGYQRFVGAFAADDRNAHDAAQALGVIADDSTQPAIARASALARLAAHPGDLALASARASAGDANALVRRSALEILDAYPPRDRIGIAASLLRDSSRSVRIEAARLLAPAANTLDGDAKSAFSSAAAEFVASQRLHADRPENRTSLGIFFAQLGRTAEAANEYRAALRLDPRHEPAYVNLADLLRGQGREAEAETALRSGIAVSSGDATLHNALGLSLVRSGKLAAAIQELARAASLAPDNSHFVYVYAVALHSAGRNRDAIAVLERARVLHADDREILFALATFNRDAGNKAAALRFAKLLVQTHPGDGEARALLESLASTPSR